MFLRIKLYEKNADCTLPNDQLTNTGDPVQLLITAKGNLVRHLAAGIRLCSMNRET